MLMTNPLERLLGQASKIRILRFLVASDLELNGREIATAAGLSHVKVHTALKELNQYNVVEMRRAGKAILYRLNLKNILVKKMIIPLFEKEARLKNMLAEIVMAHLKRPAPKSVILFGSFATSRARPDSDIDLLIIAAKKGDVRGLEKGLRKSEISVTIGFGNHLAPILMDAAEFKARFKKGERFARDIARDGKVISGESINDLVKPDDKTH